MSDLLDEYPLYFAIREMHQKFNENSGAFSWLGFCMDSAGFRQELMENQEFELIGSVWIRMTAKMIISMKCKENEHH